MAPLGAMPERDSSRATYKRRATCAAARRSWRSFVAREWASRRRRGPVALRPPALAGFAFVAGAVPAATEIPHRQVRVKPPCCTLMRLAFHDQTVGSPSGKHVGKALPNASREGGLDARTGLAVLGLRQCAPCRPRVTRENTAAGVGLRRPTALRRRACSCDTTLSKAHRHTPAASQR